MAAGFGVFSSSLKPDEFLKLWREKKKRTDGERWLPARPIQVKAIQPELPSIWQVAGVNVQPWLCWMLPPRCIFPPRSPFLIMFPRSMEPRFIIAACLHVTVNRNQQRRHLHCFCRLKQNAKNKACCDVDYCWSYRMLCSIVILPPVLNLHQKEVKAVLWFLSLYCEVIYLSFLTSEIVANITEVLYI